MKACTAVEKVCSCFGNVAYLVPLGFYDSTGRDWTASMHKTPRPSNVCFLEVQATIPLSIVSDTFNVGEQCDLSYFLHLPQVLYGGGGGKYIFGKGDVSDSITTPRRSLFNNATNLYSKFSFAPVRNENSLQGNALPSDIVITTPVVTSINQGVNVNNDAKSYAGGSKSDHKEDELNSSHGSSDMIHFVMLLKWLN